jgi:hypothetical protein
MTTPTTSPPAELRAASCSAYFEDWAVCDDMGEPKGQCAHCGHKWYAHALAALPENERESAARIQAERCLPNEKSAGTDASEKTL